MPDHSELLRRLDAKWIPEPNTGCWLWMGTINPIGYGILNTGIPGATRMAHRWSWTLRVGEIPPGMVLDHRCRVRSCVNPDHLRVVTKAQNTLENSLCWPALNKLKKFCNRGHPFSGENLRLETDKDGYTRRKCRTCDREKGAATRRTPEWKEKARLWRLRYERPTRSEGIRGPYKKRIKPALPEKIERSGRPLHTTRAESVD